jgi:hypothetical protein
MQKPAVRNLFYYAILTETASRPPQAKGLLSAQHFSIVSGTCGIFPAEDA